MIDSGRGTRDCTALSSEALRAPVGCSTSDIQRRDSGAVRRVLAGYNTGLESHDTTRLLVHDNTAALYHSPSTYTGACLPLITSHLGKPPLCKMSEPHL